MTLQNIDPTQQYVIGASRVYAYPFKITDSSHLVVTYADSDGDNAVDLTLDVHYTVSGVGDDSGGSIMLNAAYHAGLIQGSDTLTIRRVVPLTQDTDLHNQGGFFADTHEDAFDKLTMIAQQHEADLGRCIRLSPTIQDSVTELAQDPATLLSNTQTARDAALDAQAAAESAAIAVDLPSSVTGQGGKALAIKADETGYEFKSIIVDETMTGDEGKALVVKTDGSGWERKDAVMADGSNAFTANQSMGSNRLTDLANPTSAADAVTKAWAETAFEAMATTYAGEESIELPGKLVLKFGKIANPTGNPSGAFAYTVEFGTAFSNAVMATFVTPVLQDGETGGGFIFAVSNVTTTGFKIAGTLGASVTDYYEGTYWLAIGH